MQQRIQRDNIYDCIALSPTVKPTDRCIFDLGFSRGGRAKNPRGMAVAVDVDCVVCFLTLALKALTDNSVDELESTLQLWETLINRWPVG